MPALDRLLQKSAMTTEEIGRKAYELTLRGIGVEDRDDTLAERIAKEIVEAGQAGLTDPVEISSLVVERLRM